MMKRAFLLGFLALGALAQADVDFGTTCDGPYFWQTYSAVGSGASIQLSGFIAGGPGGNPGSFYRLVANWGTAPYAIVGGMSYDLWSFDPSSSEWITGLDYSTDYKRTDLSQAPGALLLQGGKAYYAALSGETGGLNSWQTSQTGHWSSSDFVEIMNNGFPTGTILPNSHPDFTATGGIIDMFAGFYRSSLSSGTSGTVTMNYDNIHYHLSTVPEPVSSLAMVAGLVGLSIRRRRKS